MVRGSGREPARTRTVPKVKLLVTGSQRYERKEAVEQYIDTLPADTAIVVTGDRSSLGSYQSIEVLPGVERKAWDLGERRGLQTIVTVGSKTKWDARAREQAFRVAVDIADAVVAFWNQEDKRTAQLVVYAWQCQKHAIVVGADGQQLTQPDAHVQAALRG